MMRRAQPPPRPLNGKGPIATGIRREGRGPWAQARIRKPGDLPAVGLTNRTGCFGLGQAAPALLPARTPSWMETEDEHACRAIDLR